MFTTKFPVSGPFGSGEEAKNSILRWRPFWISGFNYFLSSSHPNAYNQVLNQLTFRFRRRSEKKIFNIYVLIEMILDI